MKVYKVRWTPEVKRAIALFLAMIFVIGMAAGLIVGKLIFQGDAAEPVPSVYVTDNEPSVSTSGEITTPTTQPETEITQPPIEETTPPILYYDCPLSHDLQDYIRTLCETENVPMGLVIALIDRESTFRSHVISSTNDYGLMQINTVNHEWLSEQYGITDFLDPYQNVFCGIKILGSHINRYDDLPMALMAYNMGAGGAKRLWEQGIYSTSYTTYILDAMSIYDNGMIAA